LRDFFVEAANNNKNKTIIKLYKEKEKEKRNISQSYFSFCLSSHR
jgi:hypothetical protein